MPRNASVASHLNLAQPSVGRRSVARTCGRFTVQCLKAVVESYLQSRAYSVYWIGVGALPESRGNEAPQG
jgi:hypothetical protein